MALAQSRPMGKVTVRWTMPTNNVDGTPLTDLAGVKVYCGTESSNYVQVVDVPGGTPGGNGTCTVTGLVAGVTYYLSGTSSKLYTNGVLSITDTSPTMSSGYYTTNTMSPFVGCRNFNGAPNDQFNGEIDDLIVDLTEFSAGTISNLFVAGPSNP